MMKPINVFSNYFRWVLVTAVLCFVISGCQHATSEDKEEVSQKDTSSKPIVFDYDRIIERGYLQAVVDNSSTGYFIYRGRPMGYEYDLLKLLADDLGVDLKIVLTADLEEAFEMLNRGEADIMAYHLAITKKRSQKVAFTDPHNEVRQVLIQRKPDDWRDMKLHEIERALIRNPLEMVGKEVYTRKGSSYSERLNNLSEEIGGEINIIELTGQTDTEQLIRRVANGEIDYTVADEDVGLINAAYYPNIDAKTAISFPQKIAWAVRINAPALRDTVNLWLGELKLSPDFNVIYSRYFKSRRTQNLRAHSVYSSVSGVRISPYDELIKEGAASLELDWRLLASLVYQESKFDPEAKSWAGAKGLMQLTDISVEQYDVQDPFDPDQNISAGMEYLGWLDELWSDKVADEEERLKFMLASYNVGQGHVLDAVRLARKYDRNPEIWEDNVEYFLLQKSKSEFYNDPVVKYGYCRGHEPVNYVHQILNRYDQYRNVFDDLKNEGDSILVKAEPVD